MSPRDDRAILLDIVTAARNLGAFIAGMNEMEFREDKKTQAAVQHQIMVIGEAAKLLSISFREAHSDIPWTPIARMRDKLIHGYASVDLSVVWATAVGSVPQLLALLEPLAPPENGGL